MNYPLRPGFIFFGHVTSNTGAGVALPPQGCHSLTVKASIANTGVIYIGDSTITSGGFDLQPGESETLPVTDASNLFHMASVDGQTLEYIGVT